MRTVRLIIKWSLFLSILTTVGCEKPKALYTLKPWNENVAQPDAAPELAVKMQAAIFKDPSLSRYRLRIGLSERNGAIVLTGVLPSDQLKDSLMALATRVIGSEHVVDQIEVAK